jgi:DNA-binding transcriptional LysR family regulator
VTALPKAGRVHRALSDTDLRSLRVFKAVVDNGGFAASEVALGRSKSAISIDIGALERRFGMRLCERGRSGFALTAEGEAIYRAVNTLFEDLDRFSAEVSEASSRLFGRATLAVIDNIGSIAAEAMIAGIRQFRTRHPGVRLSLRSGSASEVERAVLDRTAQVGVSILPRPAPELEARPLFVESQRLYCARSHPLFDVDDGELVPDRIAHYPMISLQTAGGAAVETPGRGSAPGAEADNLDCLILVILAGMDLGYLPPHYARHWVEAGELRALRPDLYSRRNTFHLISLKQAKLAPLTRALLETFEAAFTASPVDGDAG